MVDWRTFRDGVEGDDPETEGTREAHLAAAYAANRQLNDWEHVDLGAQLRIQTNRGYVAVIVGQRSATGHGMQGLNPERIAELREYCDPFWLVFIDGHTVWSCWPHAMGPELTVNIALDTVNRRQGWKCEDLAKSGVIQFPLVSEIPPVVESLFTIGG